MPQMESLFKLLYTGVTRCCNRLIFVETQNKPASQAFFRWLKNRELAELYVPSDQSAATSSTNKLEYLQEENLLGDADVIYMSNDEWRLRGIELLLSADQESSRSNLKFFTNARVCFERAGELAKQLRDKVQVQIDAEILKTKFMKYFSTTRGSSVTIPGNTLEAPPGFTGNKPAIAEVSAVILRCVKEGLLQEAFDIALLMKPCVADTPSSRHFNAEIIGPLKMLAELRR
jgi:hypothetical protein